MTVVGRIARELLLFVLLFAVAAVLTWPLAANLGTALPDLGDPILNAWILDWDLHALTHAPLHLFDAPIYYPAKYPLAFSENLLGIAVLMLPFHAAGLDAIELLNLAVLLGFAFSAYGMTVLARATGRSLIAATLAGILFAFCGFAFEHLSHVQIIWSGWLPLMFAALFAYWRSPSPGRAATFGAAFLMNGLTNIHWLLFGGFAVVLTIVFLAVSDVRRSVKFWVPMLGALCVASLFLIPVLLPYRTVADLYGMRRIKPEVDGGSAAWKDWLVSNPRSWMWRFQPENDRPERRLFPGVMLLSLAASGLFFSRARENREETQSAGGNRILLRALDLLVVVLAIESFIGTAAPGFTWSVGGRTIVALRSGVTPFTLLIAVVLIRLTIRLPNAFGGSDGTCLRTLVRRSRFASPELAAVLWIALGVLGSLGTNSFFHEFLFEHVGAFASIRTPARWAILAYLGLAVWAALGIDSIWRERSRGVRAAGCAAMAVLILLDVAPHTRWQQAITTPAPVYTFLRDEKVRGPILELPMSGWTFPFPYLLGSTTHHVPIMNGTSGFEPPLHSKLRTMTERCEYGDQLLALLEANHCRIIIVHPDWLLNQSGPALRWLDANVAAGRLALIRRFDHDISGDYVFAIVGTNPEWKRLTRPGFRDPAGNTDRDNFDRLLHGWGTYSTATFGRIEEPRMDDEVIRHLRVRGWALAPTGIRRITVLADSGRYRFPVRTERRPDVVAGWPWYDRVPEPGFIADLPKRPRGMSRLTDIQVEVEDGRGVVTRLPDVLVDWH